MYTYHHNRVLCYVNFRFYIFTNFDWISNSVWLLNKSISICPTLSLSSYPPSSSPFLCFHPYPKHCKVMIPHELIVRPFPSFFKNVSAAHHSYLALSVKNFKKLLNPLSVASLLTFNNQNSCTATSHNCKASKTSFNSLTGVSGNMKHVNKCS